MTTATLAAIVLIGGFIALMLMRVPVSFAMLLSTLGSFLAIGLFGLMPMWILGVVCLALFGWLSAVSSLLQYTMMRTCSK